MNLWINKHNIIFNLRTHYTCDLLYIWKIKHTYYFFTFSAFLAVPRRQWAPSHDSVDPSPVAAGPTSLGHPEPGFPGPSMGDLHQLHGWQHESAAHVCWVELEHVGTVAGSRRARIEEVQIISEYINFTNIAVNIFVALIQRHHCRLVILSKSLKQFISCFPHYYWNDTVIGFISKLKNYGTGILVSSKKRIKEQFYCLKK